MSQIIQFILRSSANPNATSASIKFALIGVIPYLMQAFDLACDFGYQCYNVDPTLLNTMVEALANGAFYLLSLISIVGTIWGLTRKLYLTMIGENQATKKN